MAYAYGRRRRSSRSFREEIKKQLSGFRGEFKRQIRSYRGESGRQLTGLGEELFGQILSRPVRRRRRSR